MLTKVTNEKCMSNPFSGKKEHIWRYGGNFVTASRKCAYCGLCEVMNGKWKPA